VRGHLSEGMQIAAIRQTEMDEQFAMLRVAVPSTAESVLGRSPTEAFRVFIVDELVTDFQKQD
jgi:hypothetical protein